MLFPFVVLLILSQKNREQWVAQGQIVVAEMVQKVQASKSA